MDKANKHMKNNASFTGVEAAIVQIVFVAVAAVFSNVMLGAAFLTPEKSKEVVHMGVDMATSSVQTSGDIVAACDPAHVAGISKSSPAFQCTWC